jgi:hypothetical protein
VYSVESFAYIHTGLLKANGMSLVTI